MTYLKYTVAALALLPTAAFAADDEIIVTATRAPQNAAQVGQAITVIDGTMLEQRQTISLADILTTTPGITFARNGGVGNLTSLFIRGASSEHTLVVIDGVRVNDPSTPGGSYDFGNLLSGNIQRVEILRGADSVPWGSSAIGGVINVSTFTPTKQLSGALTAEGGSYDTKSINGHISDTLGPVALSLSGGLYNTGGISAFAKSEGGKEADGFDQHYVNARAEVKVTDTVSLDFRGRYARGRVDIDGFASVFPFGNIDTPEYSTTQELSGYAGIKADLFDNRFHNRLGYSTTYIKRETFDPSQPAAFQFEFGYKGRTQRVEYQGDFKVIEQARLVFGAEHEASSLTTEADAFNPAATYRTHVDSVYAQLVVTPVQTLTLTGGVRHDRYGAIGALPSKNATTFSANGAWRVTGTTILRASYAEGFKNPTLYQLFAPFYGTASLKPETATSYDGGIEQTALNGAIKARVTYFNRRTLNLIDGPAPSFQFININRARAEGVEFELALNPTKRLNVTANYTHTKSINANTLMRLARRPDDSVAVSIDWDARVVKVGGTVQMVGNSYDNPSNTALLQSYVLVGLRAVVPVSKNLELYGRIDNLFDEQYQVVKHYGTLGRAVYAGIRAKF